MGDDSPRAHAHKKAHAGHLRVEHGNLHQLASFLLALSHGPKTTSINPGHHAFPTLLLPAEYSDFHRFCASVYHTFNFPDSVAGVVVFVVVNSSIVLAFISLCLESFSSARSSPRSSSSSVYWDIDALCASLFLVDYAVRLVTCFAVPWTGDQAGKPSFGRYAWHALRNLTHFVLTPLNIIDAIATLTTIAALADGSSDVTRHLLALRSLRLLRIVHALDPHHEDSAAAMVGRALLHVADVLLFLFFALAVYAAFFSTAIFLCEAGAWSDAAQAYVRPGESRASPFASLPHSLWWAVATFSAMGYGDLVPTTSCGKTVGTVAILTGALFLTVPVAVIVASFGKEYDARVARQHGRETAAFIRRMEGDAPAATRTRSNSASGAATILSMEHAVDLVPPSSAHRGILSTPSSHKAGDHAAAAAFPVYSVRHGIEQHSSRASGHHHATAGSSSTRRASSSAVHPLPLDHSEEQPIVTLAQRPGSVHASARRVSGAGVVAAHDLETRSLLSTLLQESRESRALVQRLSDQVAALQQQLSGVAAAPAPVPHVRASTATRRPSMPPAAAAAANLPGSLQDTAPSPTDVSEIDGTPQPRSGAVGASHGIVGSAMGASGRYA